MTRRRCSRRGYAAAGCIDELSVVTSRVPRQSVGEAAPKIWSGGAPARCCVLGAAMAPIAPVAAARAAHAPQLSAWTSSTLSPRWSRGRRQWRRHPKSGPAACQLAAAGLAPLWRRSIGPSLLLAPLERRSWPQAQAQRRHLDGLVAVGDRGRTRRPARLPTGPLPHAWRRYNPSLLLAPLARRG